MKKIAILFFFFTFIVLGCKEKIPAPAAKFSTNIGTKGQVLFNNQSTDANSYQWDFGDGIGKSTEQNPSYTYAKPGRYTISLKATGAGGDAQAQNTIDIAGVKSTAAFSFTYLANGEVQFANQSANADAYNWTFEGNGTSTQKDPKVAYILNQ
jgi:PKD repeat protein